MKNPSIKIYYIEIIYIICNEKFKIQYPVVYRHLYDYHTSHVAKQIKKTLIIILFNKYIQAFLLGSHKNSISLFYRHCTLFLQICYNFLRDTKKREKCFQNINFYKLKYF